MADLLPLLERSGAVLRGHFILSSGRHSDTYFEKFRVLEQPAVLSELCCSIAEHHAGQGFTHVAGPLTGGILIAMETARQMGLPAIYVENENGRKTLRRGAGIPEGAKVLVVDDVLTTGLSLVETIDAVKRFGGDPAAAAVLIDRSGPDFHMPIPIFAVCRVDAQSWAPGDLPDELKAIPAVKPGTRRD
ncbi:MAG: orotate phosphoribosyltransferase [Fimbriimonadaceae bacterium]|nr:orotate phosphoribosyltransferase [Fimbriimonadaceae bacterium]